MAKIKNIHRSPQYMELRHRLDACVHYLKYEFGELFFDFSKITGQERLDLIDYFHELSKRGNLETVAETFSLRKFSK